MKWAFLLVFSLFLFSCESEECKQAKKDYENYQKNVANAELLLSQAEVTVNSLCGIFEKEKSVSASQACDAAKKGLEAAKVGLEIAKKLSELYRIRMENICKQGK